MTTIFYKKLLGRYEIVEISDPRGETIRIEFEEPIDANIILSDMPYPVTRGVCNITSCEIVDGYIVPKLYTGGSIQSLEGFIVKKGAVMRKPADEEYTRRLCANLDGLLARICSLEAKVCELQNKIERKITF